VQGSRGISATTSNQVAQIANDVLRVDNRESDAAGPRAVPVCRGSDHPQGVIHSCRIGVRGALRIGVRLLSPPSVNDRRSFPSARIDSFWQERLAITVFLSRREASQLRASRKAGAGESASKSLTVEDRRFSRRPNALQNRRSRGRQS